MLTLCIAVVWHANHLKGEKGGTGGDRGKLEKPVIPAIPGRYVQVREATGVLDRRVLKH
jgi:hypothetical protein